MAEVLPYAGMLTEPAAETLVCIGVRLELETPPAMLCDTDWAVVPDCPP